MKRSVRRLVPAFVPCVCHTCGITFEKSHKEYNRIIESGRTHFFCNRGCHQSHKNKNLSPERRAQISRSNTERKTKYATEDRPFQEYIRRAGKRLRGRHGNIDITAQYLRSVWEKQNGRCALSGIPLVHCTETHDINVLASLDRINNNIGYLKGNVQFLSCAINYAKNRQTDDSILKLFDLIREHQGSANKHKIINQNLTG